jgi:hypothetical protein
VPGLFALGGDSDGFIHIGDGLLAGIAVALIAVLKVVQIILKEFHAKPGEAFLTGVVQGDLGLQFVDGVGMFAELLDGGIGAPVGAVLALALFVQRVNQEVVGPQDKHHARDPQNHEPLEHDAEPIASALFLLGIIR